MEWKSFLGGGIGRRVETKELNAFLGRGREIRGNVEECEVVVIDDSKLSIRSPNIHFNFQQGLQQYNVLE